MTIRWWRRRNADPNELRDERLSAYLDGALEHDDAAALESEVRRDPELAAALEGMRAVRAGLDALESPRAPRSFALSPEMAGRTARRSRPRWRSTEWALRGATVTAAAGFALALAIDLNESAPEVRLVPGVVATQTAGSAEFESAAQADDERAADGPEAESALPFSANPSDGTASEPDAEGAESPPTVVTLVIDEDEGSDIARIAVTILAAATAILASATIVQWRSSRRRRA